MRTPTTEAAAMLAALTLLFLADPACAAGPGYARVSDLRGHLAVYGTEEDAPSYAARNTVIRAGDTLWTDDRSRAEIELPGGGFLRLADHTRVEVRSLDDDGEFRVLAGSVCYDGGRGLREPARVRVPEADCEIPPGGVLRIDLAADERARFSAYRAGVRLELASGRGIAVPAYHRVYLSRGNLDGAAAPFDYEDLDDFDRYHRVRVAYYERRPLHPYLDRDVMGARDLNDYGDWLSYRGERYWRPRSEPGWRPYSRGYWSYDPGVGYCWIDDAPWVYCTSHYGRWVYIPAIGGWCWRST
jgi:hypothetical protein